MAPPDDPDDREEDPTSDPSQADDPPLSELAAAATDRAHAKTIGAAAARLPAAPKIPAPPAIGTRARPKPGLAFAFDLGDDDGPVSLSKLTAGPAVTAREAADADEEAPTIAREEAGAADALAREAAVLVAGHDTLDAALEDVMASADALPSPDAVSEDAGPSGRSGATRLPPPGMLGKRPAEFRDARRAPRAPMGPGIVPPGGVMPPGSVERPRKPEDTNVLIDVVAAELMEPDSGDELPVIAPAPAAREAALATAPRASAGAHASADAPPSKRWMIAAAAVLLLGVAVWGMSRDSDPAPSDTAKAVAKASPGEASMVAKIEPPRAADPAREPAEAAGEDEDADEGDGADKAAADEAGALAREAAADDAAGSGGEAAPEDMVPGGADAEAPPPEPVAEATPAATSPSAASSSASPSPSKSSPAPSKSSKSSKQRSKSASSDAGKPKPADASSPAAAPATSGSEDPKALLTQARTALNAGNGSKAYTLASKSNKIKYSSEAIEVMTMASCVKKDEGRAKALFKQVPLFRRTAVKNKCKSAGVKVGI